MVLFASLYINLHLYKWFKSSEKYMDKMEEKFDQKISEIIKKQNEEMENKIHPLRGILDITKNNKEQ
jgi:hypothetical protein